MRLLEASSYEVQGFKCAGDFLFELSNGQPECMIVDLQMPKMTGLELQHRLASTGVNIPTIVISAHDEPGTREQCIAAGALAYLLKPIRKAALLTAIDTAIEASINGRLRALGEGPEAPMRQRYQQIVDRFEESVRANVGTVDRLSDICKVVGLGHRTVLRAVRIIHGTTPFRFAKSLRLSEVRKALLSAHLASETVTAVAMRFGFRELGRFAADYRAAFGESPSETVGRGHAASRHSQ